MTRKELTQEMRALSEMMGKTKNCTKTEWERTNKKQYAEYKAEHDRLRAEYDRKYAGSTTSPEKREKPRKTASAPAKTSFLWEEEKKSREDRIKELMRYGYSREAAERGVAAADEFWARERKSDALTPRIVTVVGYDPKGKPAKSKGSTKQGKSTPRKPSFDVKATYTRVAKPAVGTKEERIKRITALGLSREAAVKAIKAEDEYRAREQRIQSAMPKKPTAAPTYTVWDGKRVRGRIPQKDGRDPYNHPNEAESYARIRQTEQENGQRTRGGRQSLSNSKFPQEKGRADPAQRPSPAERCGE